MVELSMFFFSVPVLNLGVAGTGRDAKARVI